MLKLLLALLSLFCALLNQPRPRSKASPLGPKIRMEEIVAERGMGDRKKNTSGLIPAAP